MAKSQTGFFGFEQFVWFTAVVEDRLDPMKLGRVRIRVLGIHTENKIDIPTEELPWAYPVQPITSASMNGIGESPLGPVEGTWVVGFFRDSDNCQEPVIIGTLAGIPREYPYPKNKKIGFVDPLQDLSKRPRKIKTKTYLNDGNGAILEEETPAPETGESYPRTSHPYGPVINESDINRLARNEKISETIVKIKREQRDKSIPIADGTRWDEPSTPYYSSYPYNHITESESGHIMEVDDTPGVERLHTYHRSGTFSEIYPDGIKVEKIVGNNYKIVLEEQYEHIQNRYNLTIDGPFNVLVQNDANIVVAGNANIIVGGSLTEKVGGDYSLQVEGKLNIEAQGDIEIKSGQSTLVGAQSSVALKAASVTSNPAINQALESLKASGIGVVIAKPPLPQSASVSVPSTSSVERTYPKPIPIYSAIVETFAPIEDNFNPTPEVEEYRKQLVAAGIIDTPPTEEEVKAIPEENKVKVVEETKLVEVPTCSGYQIQDRVYRRELDSLQLSPNYSLGELYDKKNSLQPQRGLTVSRIVCNIKNASINIMEPLAGYYGKNKMIVTSGFRNVGSPNSPTSVHPTGEAFDIVFLSNYSSPSDREKHHFDVASEIISKKIVPAFDQLILECPGTNGPWIHLGYVSTSLGGPSGRQRGKVNTWFGGNTYLAGLVKR